MFQIFKPVDVTDPKVQDRLYDNEFNARCDNCKRWTSIRFHLKDGLCPDCS